MIDYSKLDDSDLEIIASGKIDYSKLSDAALEQMALTQGSQQQVQQAPQEQVTQDAPIDQRIQAGIESFGNALTLGYLPQLQAGVGKLLFPEQSYTEQRDINVRRQQAQQEQFPTETLAGSLAGTAVSIPVGGAMAGAAKIPQATSALGRVLSGAASGAAFGAAQNVGETEGEISPLQLEERLKNAAYGLALGGGTAGAGALLSKAAGAISKAPEKLKSVAGQLSLKSTGANLKHLKQAVNQAGGTENLDEIGNVLIDKGIVKAGDTFEDIASKANDLKIKTGNEISNIYKEASKKISDPEFYKNISQANKDMLKRTELSGSKLSEIAFKKINKNLINNLDDVEAKTRVQGILERLQAKGENIELTDLQEMKVNLDGLINYDKRLSDAPIVQQQMREVRRVLSKAINNRVEAISRASGGELGKKLKDSNKLYGQLSVASNAAKDRAQREIANNYFSLTDKIAGSAIAAGSLSQAQSPEDLAKTALYGLVTAKASNIGRKYSLPILANTTRKLGEALKKPANFARFGQKIIDASTDPRTMGLVVSELSNDPKFLKLIEIEKEENGNR